jgi:hypothetical protein
MKPQRKVNMEGSVVIAIISAGAALAVAAVSYTLNKQRERESEWRKVKLEHYREYIRTLCCRGPPVERQGSDALLRRREYDGSRCASCRASCAIRLSGRGPNN